MKIKLAILLFATLTMIAAAADQPQSPLTVAVYDFKAVGDIWTYGRNVTALVTANLATETNLVMLERAELDKALNEQAFGISGMVSSDAAAKIGQITGAKVLVAGQVIKTGDNHLVIVADIIGTETGRLFADKVEGAEDNLSALTSDLSHKIAQTISDQTTNLIAASQETSEEHLEQIIKSISGTNRPSVSVSISRYRGENHDIATEGELGAVLLKAGFAVVDDNSDRKPDVEIIGAGQFTSNSHQGGLFSASFGMDVKIQERRTGDIIAFDHQESTATDAGHLAAMTAAQVKTVDDLAERILPLLAK